MTIQIFYIGTGEAFDHRLPNTSVVYNGGRRVLFDCGYAVPHALWAQNLDPNWLDAIYISHAHADHCFGLPAVIARMGEDGRRRALSLLGGPDSRAAITRVLEIGYPGMMRKAPFELQLTEIAPQSSFAFGTLTLSTAQSDHKLPNHAVRVDEAGRSVCYSGDGGPTEATERLYQGASLLICEAYHAAPRGRPGHGSIAEVVALAERCRVQALHLVHLGRNTTAPTGLTCPRPGQRFTV